MLTFCLSHRVNPNGDKLLILANEKNRNRTKRILARTIEACSIDFLLFEVLVRGGCDNWTSELAEGRPLKGHKSLHSHGINRIVEMLRFDFDPMFGFSFSRLYPSRDIFRTPKL